MTDDASASFRGFRHQALYILSRILDDDSSAQQSYRPEGSEDLAVYDRAGNLIEAIQVKDHSSPLALSNLKNSFWKRFWQRRQASPSCRTKIATFNELGPELDGAIKGETLPRDRVVAKLRKAKFPVSQSSAVEMLDELHGNVLRQDASKLKECVHEAIRKTSIGGDVGVAAELLMYWVFEASENCTLITRKDLLLKLQEIGEYLAALRDTSQEWGRSIIPIKTLTLTEEIRNRWIADFRKGVHARWEHILADADSVRTSRVAEIHRSFQQSRIVIIRGASGQGKSALGWRYIHDYSAEGARFLIRHVDGPSHALTIANALGDHARKLKLRGVVYIDVSPSDLSWSRLASELASVGMKVLVTVREEDFRRENIATGDFDFTDVSLDGITQEEAAGIFETVQNNEFSHALDFEDAWARFNKSKAGPLLEFAHFVSQGETLRSRIKSQLHRLRSDAAAIQHGILPAHLELLALAAVANETGSRVSLTGLFETVGLDPITHSIHIFDEEYLLRVDSSGKNVAVAPLHPLRSQALVEVLFKELPRSWVDYAQRVLPLVVESDIGSFLLGVFSRREDDALSLLPTLNALPPKSWTHAGGISGALMWLGASRYEIQNRDAIKSAVNQFGPGWWTICDANIAADSSVTLDLRATLEETLNRSLPEISLTPKLGAYSPFLEWVETVVSPPAPITASDWQGVGEIAFWIGHQGGSGALRDTIAKIYPSILTDDLDLETIASWISGRAQMPDRDFRSWHSEATSKLESLFVEETDSELLINDGIELIAVFAPEVIPSSGPARPGEDTNHQQAMKLVRLLQLLFPFHEYHGSKGLGTNPLRLDYDSSFKRITQNPNHRERSTHLNSVFLALVAYRHQRPESWKDYAAIIFDFRVAANDLIRGLHRSWSKLFSSKSLDRAACRSLPTVKLQLLEGNPHLPMFPRHAVDEWGTITETRRQDLQKPPSALDNLFRRFGKWQKSIRDYHSGIFNFSRNAFPVTLLFAREHEDYVATDDDTHRARLLVVNLAAAWEALPEMQEEFRKQFGHLYPASELDRLEAYERSNFQNLWPAAVGMHTDRQTRIPNFTVVKERAVEQIRETFLQILGQELNETLGEDSTSIVTTNLVLNDTPHLGIICRFELLFDLEEGLESIMQAVWRACRFKEWSSMEWQPLVAKWPKIAVFRLLSGRILAPECVSLDTMVLCAKETLEPGESPVIPLAIEVGESKLLALGIPQWNHPLLERVFTLRGTILAAGLVAGRLFEIMDLLESYEITEEKQNRVLDRYNHTLTTAMAEAVREYRQLRYLLESLPHQEAPGWINRLDKITANLTFSSTNESAVSLTADDFVKLDNCFGENSAKLNALASEIVAGLLQEPLTGSS